MMHDVFTGADPVTGQEFLLTVWHDPASGAVAARTLATRSSGPGERWSPPVDLTAARPEGAAVGAAVALLEGRDQ